MSHCPNEGKSERVGYLIKAQREKVRLGRGPTRAWFVNAWRIVDLSGQDLIQPWCDTKKEARETAKAYNIKLIEEKELE